MIKRPWSALAGVLILTTEASGAVEMPTADTFTNSIGMEFVRVEPGRFPMGSKAGDYDEQPVHEVKISQPFYLGVHEVTNEEYEKFKLRHVNTRGKKGFSIDDTEPALFVDWYEAKAFCEWLSRKEGLPYRLPTEAEWEYACRAGKRTRFSTGEELPDGYLKNPGESWYPDPDRSAGWDDVVKLHVAQNRANPWGLYDMHGNVEEWCRDWYGPYPNGPQVDPVGRVDGTFKVTRGGSHSTTAYYLRSANRMGALPKDRSWFIGFRVALGKLPDTQPLPEWEPSRYQRNVKQAVPPDVRDGPAPEKPYFRGPRNFVKIPPNSHGPLFSRHNHCSAITHCPNGDLLAMWFTTESESGREMGVAASRLPYGEDQWQPASLAWDAPDRDDPALALWYDGDQTLYNFISVSTASTWGPLAVMMRTSIDNGASWSRPRLIRPGHQRRHQTVESVFRTEEGYLVLPADATPSGTGGTALHISRDGGKTWRDAGGTIAGIHAGVAQVDGGHFIAFGRGDEVPESTRFFPHRWRGEKGVPRQMPMSISHDYGRTWKYRPSPFPPISGGQRLVLLELQEGPLFFASFANHQDDDDRPAPPMRFIDAAGEAHRLFGLFGALSYDGGKTWKHVKPIVPPNVDPRASETTNGESFQMSPTQAEPEGYMSVCQARNGIIHLTTSWNHYSFNLKWLRTPAPAPGNLRTRENGGQGE